MQATVLPYEGGQPYSLTFVQLRWSRRFCPGGRALRTPRCGLGLVVQPLSCSVSGARCSCSGWTWTGPTASPAAPATPNARCWITSRPTSTSPAAGCCRSACYATPSTSPVPTGHRLFLPPARCHRDRAVLRGHPPPRGACQDRLRQRRGPIPPGLVATAHPPTRRCGQNAKPGRLRAPVQRAYRTLRSAPNVSHAPTLQPPRRTAVLYAGPHEGWPRSVTAGALPLGSRKVSYLRLRMSAGLWVVRLGGCDLGRGAAAAWPVWHGGCGGQWRLTRRRRGRGGGGTDRRRGRPGPGTGCG